MSKRLALGAVLAFIVIFNLGYVFHEIVAADFLRGSFGPGVQRARYIIPVIALALAIYVTLMAAAYPVAWAYFARDRGWSRVATGALEYATYNVSLPAMLVDSAYHTVEGVLAGVIIGACYRPAAA